MARDSQDCCSLHSDCLSCPVIWNICSWLAIQSEKHRQSSFWESTDCKPFLTLILCEKLSSSQFKENYLIIKNLIQQVACSVRGKLDPPCNAVGYIDRKLLGINHMYQHPAWKRSKVSNGCLVLFSFVWYIFLVAGLHIELSCWGTFPKWCSIVVLGTFWTWRNSKVHFLRHFSNVWLDRILMCYHGLLVQLDLCYPLHTHRTPFWPCPRAYKGLLTLV